MLKCFFSFLLLRRCSNNSRKCQIEIQEQTSSAAAAKASGETQWKLKYVFTFSGCSVAQYEFKFASSFVRCANDFYFLSLFVISILMCIVAFEDAFLSLLYFFFTVNFCSAIYIFLIWCSFVRV